MRAEAYDQYTQAIAQYKKGGNITFNKDVLTENRDSKGEVLLTIKNYAIEGGISDAMHESNTNSTF